jgi:hypothetical protein
MRSAKKRDKMPIDMRSRKSGNIGYIVGNQQLKWQQLATLLRANELTKVLTLK